MTRKSTIAVITACAIASAFVIANARAADLHIPASPFCVKEADATAQLQVFLKAHDGAEMNVLDGEEAAAWMFEYNHGLPPSSDYVADKIWVVSNPKQDGSALRLALFVKGETCMSIPMPFEMFKQIGEHARRNTQ